MRRGVGEDDCEGYDVTTLCNRFERRGAIVKRVTYELVRHVSRTSEPVRVGEREGRSIARRGGDRERADILAGVGDALVLRSS